MLLRRQGKVRTGKRGLTAKEKYFLKEIKTMGSYTRPKKILEKVQFFSVYSKFKKRGAQAVLQKGPPPPQIVE